MRYYWRVYKTNQFQCVRSIMFIVLQAFLTSLYGTDLCGQDSTLLFLLQFNSMKSRAGQEDLCSNFKLLCQKFPCRSSSGVLCTISQLPRSIFEQQHV